MPKNNEKSPLKAHLGPEEHIIYEFSVGRRVVIWGTATIAILGLITIPIVIGIFGLIGAVAYYYLYPKSRKYALTNKRVLAKVGLLSTKMITIPYNKITDIYVQENFSDKLITKTGQLHINTAGGHGKELVFKYIEDPYAVESKISEMLQS